MLCNLSNVKHNVTQRQWGHATCCATSPRSYNMLGNLIWRHTTSFAALVTSYNMLRNLTEVMQLVVQRCADHATLCAASFMSHNLLCKVNEVMQHVVPLQIDFAQMQPLSFHFKDYPESAKQMQLQIFFSFIILILKHETLISIARANVSHGSLDFICVVSTCMSIGNACFWTLDSATSTFLLGQDSKWMLDSPTFRNRQISSDAWRYNRNDIEQNLKKCLPWHLNWTGLFQ